MSGPITRADDRSMFKLGGLSDFVEDRPNQIPLAELIEDANKQTEAYKLTSDEALQRLQEARNRPQFKTFTRLQQLDREANKKNEEKRQQTNVLNMSIYQFFMTMSDRLNQIVNDIANFSKNNYSLYDILTANDRLIYVGTLLVVLSFLTLLIQYVK